MKRLIYISLFCIVSTAFAVGISELVLRQFFPIYNADIESGYEYDPETGYRLKAGVHLLATTDYQKELQLNSLGTVNFQNDFSGYQTLVFAAGDSYTQGIGVPADSAFPFQLDLRLNLGPDRTYHKNYGIVNLGVGGFGTLQSILRIKEYATHLGNPKYILFLGCDNDVDDDAQFRLGLRHSHLVDGSPRWGIWSHPLQMLSNNFQLLLRLKISLALARGLALHKDSKPRPLAEASLALSQSAAEQQSSSLESLLKQSKELDADLIVSWANDSSSYIWLQKWAAERHVSFADWLPRTRDLQRKIPSLPITNHHSGQHLRSWVNFFIAQSYAENIDTPSSPAD